MTELKQEDMDHFQEKKEEMQSERFLGRMNDATASSFLTGPCGDAMEFYLVIENGKVTEVRYYTDGCAATKACGATAASLAEGRPIEDVMRISPGMILENVKGISSEHRHCSILAASTLYRALADYLLQK